MTKKFMYYIPAAVFLLFFGITPTLVAHADTTPARQNSEPGAMAGGRAYFSASTTTVPAGSDVFVAILIDAPQPVNAYEFAVSYPPQMLDLAASDNSRSLIDIWQQTPLLRTGGLSFKGGSLLAFKGNGGELLTLMFHVTQTGDAVVSFNNISLYLANGKGTKVVPETQDITLHIVPAGTATVGSVLPGMLDETPPDVTFFGFITDPFNADQKLIGFKVADAGSGVASVSLRTRSWFLWSDAAPAINPTAAPTDVWAAELQVIDNQGNVRDEVIYDWNVFARGPLASAGAVLVVAIGIVYLIRKQRRIS